MSWNNKQRQESGSHTFLEVSIFTTEGNRAVQCVRPFINETNASYAPPVMMGHHGVWIAIARDVPSLYTCRLGYGEGWWLASFPSHSRFQSLIWSLVVLHTVKTGGGKAWEQGWMMAMPQLLVPTSYSGMTIHSWHRCSVVNMLTPLVVITAGSWAPLNYCSAPTPGQTVSR